VPGELPRTIPNLPSPPMMDDFLAKLAGIPGLVYVDAAAILRRAQVQRPVFHKTDFHWNDPAAFEVAREIVEQIRHKEGRAEPVWKHPLEIETKQFSGGIATFMPVFFPPSENGLFIKKSWTDPPDLSSFSKRGIYEYELHRKTPNGQLLPTMVVLGDSFFDGMTRSGLDIYFRSFYRVRWNGDLKISDSPPRCQRTRNTSSCSSSR